MGEIWVGNDRIHYSPSLELLRSTCCVERSTFRIPVGLFSWGKLIKRRLCRCSLSQGHNCISSFLYYPCEIPPLWGSTSSDLGGFLLWVTLWSELLVITPFSGCGYNTWPFTIKFGRGRPKRRPCGSLWCQMYSSLPPLHDRSPIFTWWWISYHCQDGDSLFVRVSTKSPKGAGSSHNLKFSGTHVISFDGIIPHPASRVKTSKPTESKVVGTGCRHSESGSWEQAHSSFIS